MDANTDFYGKAAAHRRKEPKDRSAVAKWLLFALLLFCLCELVLTTVFPDILLFFYLSPFSFFLLLSDGWFDASPLFFLLALLPLCGWLLLVKRRKIGWYFVVVPHIVRLSLNAIITVLHLATGMSQLHFNALLAAGSGSTLPIRYTLLTCAVELACSIAVLTLNHYWHPKKKF